MVNVGWEHCSIIHAKGEGGLSIAGDLRRFGNEGLFLLHNRQQILDIGAGRWILGTHSWILDIDSDVPLLS